MNASGRRVCNDRDVCVRPAHSVIKSRFPFLQNWLPLPRETGLPLPLSLPGLRPYEVTSLLHSEALLLLCLPMVYPPLPLPS